MKRNLLFYLSIVMVSAITGAATMSIINGTHRATDNTTSTIIADDKEIFRQNSVTDAHFAASVVATEYPDLTYAAENAVKAVVSIEATRTISQQPHRDPFFEFFGYPQGYGGTREARAGGSGVIISEDGYIVTNNHVIEDASKLRVKLYDGRVLDATIIGTDPTTDVALIKIEADSLPTLPFGSSDELRLGEWVLAIGYPMELQSTITAGIVSAKARSLGALDAQRSIESFIQTDAAVNPGNSGGALVNTRGELVGINTIIKTSTGSYVGYSFAIPETIVRKVVVDLKESGMVQRAVLGISFRAVDQLFIDEMGRELGIESIGGIYVASVTEGGAAAEAGVREGDIIVKVSNVEVNDNAIFLEQIGKRRPGDKITLDIRRGDKMLSLNATLQNKEGATSLLSKPDVDVMKLLGGRLKTLSAPACRELNIDGGVQVTAVLQGGLLERCRVKESYIITHINDKPIGSVEDIERLGEQVTSIEGIYPNGRALSYVIME